MRKSGADDQDGSWMEDKVRMVGVRRCFVHTRADPTWASPGHPLPLSVPPRPSLPGSPTSGTARVPAPLWKRRVVRRVRKRPRCQVVASASIVLLSIHPMRGNPFSKICATYSILTAIQLSSTGPLISSHPFPVLARHRRCSLRATPSLPMRRAFRIMPCILIRQMR
jgi:hypothetical protein